MGYEVKNTPWSPNIVQAGNPHSLTIRQHIFPRKSIARFSDCDGKVKVVWNLGNRITKESPKDQMFTVSQLWDQKTENLSTKLFEAPFQKVVDGLQSNSQKELTDNEMVICTKMYSLWQFRNELANNPPQDTVMEHLRQPFTSPSTWSQDQGEQLEKLGYAVFARGSAVDTEGYVPTIIPGRMDIWFKLRRRICIVMQNHSNLRWGIVRDPFGRVVIPSKCPPGAFLPVLPTICLVANVSDTTLTEGESLHLRSQLLEGNCRFHISGP